jgi:uncharacterized protein YabE (DUF348 family)
LLGMVGSTNKTANLSTTANKAAAAAKTNNTAPNHKVSHAPTVTTKTETETQSIPFTSTTVQTASLTKGTTKITTAGVNGSQTLTYQITDTDGQQTDKKLISTTVTLQPVTQVTSVGTYVAPTPAPAASCPNGTYVNSSGNTVCSPYSSPSAPSGATAQCVDGTYSFSQHRSGTCSYHGGVAQWL